MTTEQLPEGLQLAASLLKAHCDAHPFTHTALTAIRTAADRIADLETKCATLKRLHDAAADERDALKHGHRSQHDADSAELRRICADRDAARKERDNLIDAMREEIDEGLRLRELGGALPDENITAMTERVINERDALRTQISACTPHLRERPDGTLESPSDMLAMREREVLGLLGRLSDAQMQGDALRARPAEIVRDLPLPTGERQAVLLTDEQIERAVDGHGWTVSELQVEDIPGMARDIEAAVLAANNLEVRRG